MVSTSGLAAAGQGPAGAGRGPAQRPGAPRRRGGAGGRVRDRRKTLLMLLAGVGIIAAVIWSLVAPRVFVVRSVSVTGLYRVARPQVIAAAGIRYGTPLIQVDPAAVSRRVERITQVQSVQVTRSWPVGIDIAVTERVPALAVRGRRGYQLIDPAGIAVASVPRRPPGIALFVPSGPVHGNPAVAAAAAVARQLPPRLARNLVSVTAPTASGVTLHLTHGVTVFWGSAAQPAVKERTLAVLMAAPAAHARYYDVSMPGTAATR